MVAIFPASTKAAGQALGFPDVCKTPSPAGPIPIPYPNIGMMNQATKTSKKVKFVGKETVTLKSEISRSMGDEAGVTGGVVSSTNMGKVTFKMGCSKVLIEGQKCISLTSMTSHNKDNFPAGLVIVPSQTKVIVSP